MATTNFQVFDENKQNMLGDAEYLNSSQRLNGVQAGVASSQLHNKASYQTSLMAAALAQYMVSKNIDALDTDTVAGIANKIGSLFTGELTEIGNESLAEAFELSESDSLNKLFQAGNKKQLSIEMFEYSGTGGLTRTFDVGFVPEAVFIYTKLSFSSTDKKGFIHKNAPIGNTETSGTAIIINDDATIYVKTSSSSTGFNVVNFDYCMILIGMPGNGEYISGTVKYEDGTPLPGVKIIGGLSPYGGYPITDKNGNFTMQKIVGAKVSTTVDYVDLEAPEAIQITELTESVDFVCTKNNTGLYSVLTSSEIAVSGLFGTYQIAAINGGEGGYMSDYPADPEQRGGHGGQCLTSSFAVDAPTKITCIVGAGGIRNEGFDNGGQTIVSAENSILLQTDPTVQNGARKITSGNGNSGEILLSWAGGIRPGGSGAFVSSGSGPDYSGGEDFGGATDGSTSSIYYGKQPGGGGAADNSRSGNGGAGAIYIGWSV